MLLYPPNQLFLGCILQLHSVSPFLYAWPAVPPGECDAAGVVFVPLPAARALARSVGVVMPKAVVAGPTVGVQHDQLTHRRSPPGCSQDHNISCTFGSDPADQKPRIYHSHRTLHKWSRPQSSTSSCGRRSGPVSLAYDWSLSRSSTCSPLSLCSSSAQASSVSGRPQSGQKFLGS